MGSGWRLKHRLCSSNSCNTSPPEMVIPSYQAVLISPCELPSEVEVVHPSICQVPQLKMLSSAKCISKTLKPWSKCRGEWRCASCRPPSPWPTLRRSFPHFSKTPRFVCFHPSAQELASSVPWRRRGQNRIQLQRGKHQRQNFHSSRTCFFKLRSVFCISEAHCLKSGPLM